jgi:hypothetical protein
MESPSYKIGTADESGGMREFHYPDHFSLQEISGMKRLVVGPSTDHVGLILEFSDFLSEPFRILYVLVEPVGVKEEDMGRFELENQLSREDMRAFFERFRDFFEADARHHVWLASPTGTIVYDQHNVLYAYGPVLDFEKVLLARGLTPGDVAFPFPHLHRFHPDMDPMLNQLLQEYEWRWYPLDTRQDVYR